MAIKPIEILIRAKDEASGVFSSMGSKVAAVGALIASYFGINAFIGAVKGAGDLEAKLSEVKAVSNATADEMMLLRKAAEDAGATTKFTATEGADALGNLARAGLNAKDAIAALPAVLQLAQAGGIGLAEASEYISKTVMGMGLAFTDAGRVADVLAMGANASNTSVTGLAQALSYAAPLAKSLGLDLETTVAIIGKFADAGIDASRAGTALNAIMAQFADPASKFRTELAGAGIATNNFEKALRQLAAAGPAGSKAINAVGTEAGPALRALLNQGIGALDELKGKLDGAAGSAAATAKVMQDNLKGSISSLSSVWDTVKNTLTTPVLPVLRDGVDKLTAAFTNAVNSGVVGKFGESIATAFQSGIKWAQDFVARIDFNQVAADLRAFADRAGEVFTQIGEHARAAGDSAKLAYGVMSAGVNTVLGAVYLVGEAFAGVASNIQSGLALIMQGFAKVTFGDLSKAWQVAADDMRLSAEATWAASEALAAKSSAAFARVADGAQMARDGFDGLSASGADAAGKSEASSKAFDQVASSLTSIGDAATDAATKVKASTDAQAQATDDLRKKAEEDAQAISDAFARMGIQTKTELSTAAATARADFDKIKASGLATADGLQAAYKKVAEAAIAANGGVASETIKSEAAMRGLEIATDSTGKAIVRAMGDGKRSTDDYRRSVEGSIGAINQQTSALEQQAQSAAARAQKLQGQNAVDNRLKFQLRDKLNAGTLTEADTANVQAVIAELKQNAVINAFGRSQGGISLAGIEDDQKWQNTGALLQQFLTEQQTRTAASAAAAQAVTPAAQTTTPVAPATQQSTSKTYTVNLNINGQNTPVNVASEGDAQALISALQRAKTTA